MYGLQQLHTVCYNCHITTSLTASQLPYYDQPYSKPIVISGQAVQQAICHITTRPVEQANCHITTNRTASQLLYQDKPYSKPTATLRQAVQQANCHIRTSRTASHLFYQDKPYSQTAQTAGPATSSLESVTEACSVRPILFVPDCRSGIRSVYDVQHC